MAHHSARSRLSISPATANPPKQKAPTGAFFICHNDKANRQNLLTNYLSAKILKPIAVAPHFKGECIKERRAQYGKRRKRIQIRGFGRDGPLVGRHRPLCGNRAAYWPKGPRRTQHVP